MPARRRTHLAASAMLLVGALLAGAFSLTPSDTRAATAPTSEALAPIAMDAGSYVTCAIRADHTLWCWGQLIQQNFFVFDNVSTIGGDGKNEPQQIGRELWIAVSVGDENVCGIVVSSVPASSGSLYCFGSNEYGQLGVNPSVLHTSVEPLRVGSDASWKSVDVGQGTVCAMTVDDLTYCIGSNNFNQFGLVGGDSSYSQLWMISPTEVSSQIVVGGGHTCFLQADNGAAHCVGSNAWGQLGDGTTADQTTWQTVTGGHRFSALTAGGLFTCGIASSTTTPASDAGKAFCWGANFTSQLGEGSPTGTSSSAPVLASSTLKFSLLRAGSDHVCGITTTGELYCWGGNWSGESGVDPIITASVATPAQIGTARNWAGIAIGSYHSCGFTIATRSTPSATSCWGDRLSTGNGIPSTVNTLTKLPGSGWLTAAVSGASRCAIKGTVLPGRLFCWGGNYNGELGDGTADPRTSPIEVVNVALWSQVAMGPNSTCAISGVGALWCWGRNDYGQLGVGDLLEHRSPVQVGSATDWSGVVVGEYATCGIRATTSVWCWGSDTNYQLGNGDPTDNATAPAQVFSAADGHTWKKVSMGQNHVCALDTVGALYCWGGNSAFFFGGGAIGDGTYNNAPSPVRSVPGLRFADVSAGYGSTCGITVGGTTVCWGANLFGSLGNGNSLPDLYFCFMSCTGVNSATVSGSNVLLASGLWSTCAIRRGGDLWCWGLSHFGATPVGSDEASAAPRKAGSGFVALAMQPTYNGQSGGCGIKADTTLWCWGSTYDNLLQNGWPNNYSTPQLVKVLYRKPVADGGAQITGLARKSSVLTADAPNFSGTPLPAVTYQWYRCTKASTAQGSSVERGCTKISRATQSTYTLVTADVNKYVRLLITAKNNGGTVTIFTSSTAKVTN